MQIIILEKDKRKLILILPHAAIIYILLYILLDVSVYCLKSHAAIT